VVIPTYQRRELVRRAIASVFAQTYRDHELIVVDDGSTDGTQEMLEPLRGRIRYRWQENRGPGGARNAGVRIARAPVVAFLDSDVRWLPDHLAVVSEMLRRHPEALIASTCPGFVAAGRERANEARVVSVLAQLMVANDPGLVSCMAARRSALLALGGFDEELAVAEDSDLWLRIAMRGPFVMVRRRTVVPQNTRGGLRERGRRSGEYLNTAERIWTRTAGELERLTNPGAGDDISELRSRAHGNRHLVAALRAIESGHDHTAAVELDRACRLNPDLSKHPTAVANRMRDYLPSAHERPERLRHLETASRVWPDQRSDAALLLRGWSFLLALRMGRLATAGRQLLAWPLRTTPGFLMRVRAPLLQRLRRWLQAASQVSSEEG
jgi:glycosyltransferase involved in cell wall biosynthesis